MNTPGGRTVNFERSTCACEVSKITSTQSGVTVVLQDNLSYRPFGGATGLSTGNSGAVANQYNLSARVEVTNSGTTKERTYAYDANGNLESITAPNTPWSEREYGYDALNRLTYAVGPYGVTEYTYDDVGNRLTEVESGVTETYSYYSNTNKIYQTTVSGSNPVTFAYDQNGNIISMGDLTFTYDQDNRLTAVVESGTTVAEYTYNGFGQRAIKISSGVTTVFHYDFDGNLIGESATNGTFSKEYLYRGSGRIAMVDVASGTTYFYLNERLGTPEMMTDSENKLVWQAIYKPFGEAEVNPNSGVTNYFRFPGQYSDEETGFHYNYHRYYDPRTGRYLTSDPIGLAGGINHYHYTFNNPIKYSDPTGLLIEIIGDPSQQTYVLNQLKRFVRGELSISKSGMLSRSRCEGDEGIEADIDDLISSEKLFRIFPYLAPDSWGRSSTVPTIEGADIHFDPDVHATYQSGPFGFSFTTPAAELAHELLGRGLQIERGEPHGLPGSRTRDLSNERAKQRANRAFIRMGMDPRFKY